MSEELRRVRDTLIEELRRSDTLTVAGRALFNRYAAMCEAEKSAAAPAPPEPQQNFQQQPPPPPPPPAAAAPPRRRGNAEDEDDEFGGSFMVRSNSPQPTIPGYRETPQQDLPRSMRDRRR